MRLFDLLMSAIERGGRQWRALQRAHDVEILWPECVRLAPDRKTALRVFAVHVGLDSAWHVPLDEITDPSQRAFAEQLIEVALELEEG